MRVKGFSDIQPSRNHVFTHRIYFLDVVLLNTWHVGVLLLLLLLSLLLLLLSSLSSSSSSSPGATQRPQEVEAQQDMDGWCVMCMASDSALMAASDFKKIRHCGLTVLYNVVNNNKPLHCWWLKYHPFMVNLTMVYYCFNHNIILVNH